MWLIKIYVRGLPALLVLVALFAMHSRGFQTVWAWSWLDTLCVINFGFFSHLWRNGFTLPTKINHPTLHMLWIAMISISENNVAKRVIMIVMAIKPRRG
ncbi:hypothetical protein JCM31185_09640 [Furfurilactobacillus curtus]|uniref:Uncharacterized protein n=1 Tax=Furfurilactobacillus curtus TaxID=1746200 RepID=A0ABQ5JME0_9LACO